MLPGLASQFQRGIGIAGFGSKQAFCQRRIGLTRARYLAGLSDLSGQHEQAAQDPPGKGDHAAEQQHEKRGQTRLDRDLLLAIRNSHRTRQ